MNEWIQRQSSKGLRIMSMLNLNIFVTLKIFFSTSRRTNTYMYQLSTSLMLPAVLR